MSTGDLTAKFILLLEDRLSAGIGKLQQRLDKLAAITRKISTPGLDATDKVLKRVQQAATGATSSMSALGNQIIYVGRNGTAAIGGVVRQLQTMQRLAAQPIRLAIAAPGGGGGGVGGGRGAIPLNPGGGGLGAHVQRFNEASEGAMGGIFGALMTGFGIGEAVEHAEELDNVLRHIAITAGAVGDAGDRMVADLRGQFQQLARDTGQSAKSVAESAFYLIQAGLPKDQVDRLTGTAARIGTAYNAAPEDVARTEFVLAEQMKIAPDAMGPALASMALAGKKSHILFPEMAQLFPQIAAEGVNAGESGRAGVDRMAAMLAISRKNTATGGEAATNMRDFIGQLNSPFTARHFAQLGVDLPSLMKNAKLEGVDPIEAVLAKVQQVTHGDANLLGKLFHNEQSRGFVLAMLQHHDEYVSLLKQLGSADEGMLNQDFGEGLKSLKVQMGEFNVEVDTLLNRVGLGLVPVMKGATFVLRQINDLFREMDEAVPGSSAAVITFIGSTLALGSALGVFRLLKPVVVAGLKLMRAALVEVLGPLRMLIVVAGAAAEAIGLPFEVGAVAVLAVAAVLIGAALLIYQHWDRFRGFFIDMWTAINMQVNGGYNVIAGLLTLDFPRVIAGFRQIWSGVGLFMSAQWEIVKGVFAEFVKWVDGWSGGLASRILAGIQSGWSALVSGFTALFDELMGPVHAFEESWVGRKLGLGGSAQAGGADFHSPSEDRANADGAVRVGGTIRIQVEGARVTGSQSDTQGIDLLPDRGLMVGIP